MQMWLKRKKRVNRWLKFLLVLGLNSCGYDNCDVIGKWSIDSFKNEDEPILPCITQSTLDIKSDSTYTIMTFNLDSGYWQLRRDSIYLDDIGFEFELKSDTELILSQKDIVLFLSRLTPKSSSSERGGQTPPNQSPYH